MPYSLTRNFSFGKIKQNHSKLNKTERNGKGEKQKMKKKILAALTAGILTTGLMTGTVFAADTEVKGDENLKGEVYAFIAASLSNSMEEIQKDFKAYVEDNGVVIAICGGYQLLGNYYKTDQGTIKGLELVDMYTEQEEGRLISNIVLQSDLFEMPVVGFENHGGRTCINDNKPLGKVLYGSGNDGKSGYEGVVYKNVIGTYLHGPLLPKNPQLADWLILHALQKKYGEQTELTPLDDSQEKEANDYICHRFLK